MNRRFVGLSVAALLSFAQTPALAQAATPAATLPPYRINPGDVLEISVWGDERLQREVRVLPDGSLAFPLVGQMMVSGQLPAELERQVSDRLAPQYRGTVPQVTVSVKNPAGFQFSVIGKVRSPGTFTPGRYLNALEALSIAGGPTEFANVGAIRLVRSVGGQLRTLRVKLNDALRGDTNAISSDDVPMIQSGDTVVVP